MEIEHEVDIPQAFLPLLVPKRYKGFYGGRGSGKSHSFATALLTLGVANQLRILCAREVQTSIKDSVKQLLDDKIEAMELSSFYHSTLSEIRGTNGTLFLFAGLGAMTTAQIKSMEGIDIAWVEEAQTISAHSLETLIPTIRHSDTLPQSELWFSWNPRNAGDPVDKRLRGEHPPENSIVVKVNHDQNRWFPPELQEEMEYDRIHNRDRFAHIWLGEYEPTAIGAIWDRQTIAANRREPREPSECDDIKRILVSVDHAISSEAGSDEHGIIVGGIGHDKRGYILEDATTKGPPQKWASRAITMFDKWDADAVVIERNQGGDLVRNTLEGIRPGLPIIEVVATRGKHVRAEPVSAQYAINMVSHCGTFTELEDQMVKMTAGGYEGDGSPDRFDALVWLITEIFPGMTTRKRDKKPHRPREYSTQGWMG